MNTGRSRMCAGLASLALLVTTCSTSSSNETLGVEAPPVPTAGPATLTRPAPTQSAPPRSEAAESASTQTASTQPAATDSTSTEPERKQPTVRVGAQVVVDDGFAALEGKRVGLITNQVSMVHGRHLIDWLNEAPNVDLVTILAAEHGVRGDAGAGELIDDEIDPSTGLPVMSLYGATRQLTPEMLEGLDTLVFDLQDVGTRYYTYTATMGLAMQAAAAAGLEFIVLDRPNPLGGRLVEGFMRTDDQVSFISQYPTPAVHGLTAGELAMMVQAERWLPGLENLDLHVVPAEGWHRAQRWTDTGLPWIAPSPGLRFPEAAALYPATVLFESTTLSYATGTDLAFQAVGAPWLDHRALADEMNARDLPGVRFEPVVFVPRDIPDVALDPRFEGELVHAVRIVITDAAVLRPTAIGVHLLEAILGSPEAEDNEALGRPAALDLLAGDPQLRQRLIGGESAASIVESWGEAAAKFAERSRAFQLAAYAD